MTDENGTTHRFIMLFLPQSSGSSSSSGPSSNWPLFFPLPSSRTEGESFSTSLKRTATGYVFKRKYGTTLVFEDSGVVIIVPGDRAHPDGPTEIHSYARLASVSDRFGTTVEYDYESTGTLIPSTIAFVDANGSRNQKLAITKQDGRVTKITDPKGNEFTFDYQRVQLGGYVYHKLTTVTGPANDLGVPETRYTYDSREEPDYNPYPSDGPIPVFHVDVAGITDPNGHAYSFGYGTTEEPFDKSRLRYDPWYGVYFPANGQPRNVTSVGLPGGGVTTFTNQSSLKIVRGEWQFEGYRVTTVTDAEGNKRVYHFDKNEVYWALDFQTLMGGDDRRVPKIVYFERTTILHFKGSDVTVNVTPTSFSYEVDGDTEFLGDEVFEFDVSAGLALKKLKDFSGNTTTFEHADQWKLEDHYPELVPYLPEGFLFGYYGDPTKQTNALQGVKTFAYDATWRVMKQVVDEKSRVTDYIIDSLGRRTRETIRPSAGAAPTQITTFDYDSHFAGFMVRRQIETINPDTSGPINPDDPAWVAPLVANYVADNYGRSWKEITDPGDSPHLNLTTIHEYDLNNNKTATTDPRGNSTAFTYDSQNRLIEVEYPATGAPPAAATKHFEYDLRGNKIQETDENGHVTLFEYDALNRLITQTRVMADDGTPNSAIDLITRYTYNAVNAKTSVTDPRGNVTQMDYDALQRLVKTTDALDQETTFEYGTNSGSSAFDVSVFKPTKTTDPRGYVTETVYDKLYRPTEKRVTYQKAPLPVLKAITKMEYDEVGNLIKETDPLNRVTNKQYDALNRLILVTFPDTYTNQTFYTSTGLNWKTIDEMGRETETEYDAAGRATKVTGPPVDNGSGQQARPVTQTVHDENGNVTATINPLNKRWDYEFDERNRKITEEQPEVFDAEQEQMARPTLHWEYDAVGNVIATTDARGNTTDSTYDAANRVIKVEAPAVPLPEGGTARPTTLTEHDKNGNVTKVTDPNGHVTGNTYDELNRLLTTTQRMTANPSDPLDITVENTYDEVGNRTSVKDGKNQFTQFEYDGLNRNTLTTDPTDKTVEFTYDAINKTARTDSLDRVTHYAYDSRNRLKTVIYGEGSDDDRTYNYDHVGNLLSVTEPGHDGKANVAYTYDNLNRVITETSGGVTHEYAYDLAGNRLRTEYGNGGRTMQSTYDALNRLSTLTESGRATDYKYDLNGNAALKNLPNGDSIETAHDAMNRVTEIVGPAYDYAYSHDLVGNVTQIVESYSSNSALNRTVANTYDRANRLVNEAVTGAYPSTTAYSYDKAHNRSQMVKDDRTTNYTYNNLNQLTGFTDGSRQVSFTYDDNGNRQQRVEGGVVDSYGYDYENRLVSLQKGGVGYAYTYDYRTRRVERVEGSTTTKIVFSGGASVQENECNALTVEYIRGSDYGGGIGGILYTLRDGNRPSYTHYNNRGDVVAKTDADQALTYQASYEAFGTRTKEVGQTQDRQKANTKDEDPTGLLNEGLRYRDLETGSFITRDPVGFVDGPNLYTYVQQNPWTKFDPEGLASAADRWYDAGVTLAKSAISIVAAAASRAATVPADPVIAMTSGAFKLALGDYHGHDKTVVFPTSAPELLAVSVAQRLLGWSPEQVKQVSEVASLANMLKNAREAIASGDAGRVFEEFGKNAPGAAKRIAEQGIGAPKSAGADAGGKPPAPESPEPSAQATQARIQASLAKFTPENADQENAKAPAGVPQPSVRDMYRPVNPSAGFQKAEEHNQNILKDLNSSAPASSTSPSQKSAAPTQPEKKHEKD